MGIPCVGWCSLSYRGLGGLREYLHPTTIENRRSVPAVRKIRRMSQKIVEIVLKITTVKKSEYMTTLSVHLFLNNLIPVGLFDLCETAG